MTLSQERSQLRTELRRWAAEARAVARQSGLEPRAFVARVTAAADVVRVRPSVHLPARA